jgi:PAS domain S-box-containing protein
MNSIPTPRTSAILLQRWRMWWKKLSPLRQDRVATLGPLMSVVLFLVAIGSALTYFTIEESNREQEAVTRDVEYAQQRLRLRLLERQEQLMRIARDVTNQDIDASEFMFQAESLVAQFPELMSVSWINHRREVVTGYTSPSAPEYMRRLMGQPVHADTMDGAFELVRDLRQPLYTQPIGTMLRDKAIMLLIPLNEQGRFSGVVLAEYSVDGLLRFGVPPEVTARYAVALVSENQELLAGTLQTAARGLRKLPWVAQPPVYEMPVAPIGNSLILRAEGYRTSRDNIGQAFFWIVGAMSTLTIWMLLANMLHTRRRLQAQRALVLETNFRRAMENSMLTGMRALDLKGRITYVNPAFCSMTGWTESDLIGAIAPFPYWPDSEHENLMARLEDELHGRSIAGGFEVPVKRKNGSIFYARMYVSPLIDAQGKQTGWMTSMTDITEPKRIREELTASYERFTTVLDSLDEAISVTPLNASELLFANRMYQTWFGSSTKGHRQLIEQASYAPNQPAQDDLDAVDGLAGLPTDALIEASADSAEIYIEDLHKWLEIRTRYLTWVDGRLAQMVIASDVTMRRETERQVSLQQERAETASRLITMGEMASSVAHELNQPLTAISNYTSGMISRLQKQNIEPEDLLGALEKTNKQALRAGQIIQRIRSFVKRSEPNPTLSDVTQMINNATELADIELRRHVIRLNTYVAARLPKLMVDPILIEQVLINLLKNAGEAIAQAQRPPTQRNIELCVTPRKIEGNDVVEFSIQDSGMGIADDQLERIFDAFYSTKSEGMGIGLKLCRSIVESHMGRLSARNLYNGPDVVGCEFSFWLPVAATTAISSS